MAMSILGSFVENDVDYDKNGQIFCERNENYGESVGDENDDDENSTHMHSDLTFGK